MRHSAWFENTPNGLDIHIDFFQDISSKKDGVKQDLHWYSPLATWLVYVIQKINKEVKAL